MGIIIGIILVLLGISAIVGVSLIKFIFAAILILVGLRIISRHESDFDLWHESALHENLLNEVAIFSGLHKIVKSDNFKGGKVVLILAGGSIDLREVKTGQKTIKLEFVSVLSGGKLFIPKEWKLDIRGAQVMGGYENRAAYGSGDTTLVLDGALVLGGLEIEN